MIDHTLQSECPQTIISLTWFMTHASSRTAGSGQPNAPPMLVACGTIFPAFLMKNVSPMLACVNLEGRTLLSAHDIIRAEG